MTIRVLFLSFIFALQTLSAAPVDFAKVWLQSSLVEMLSVRDHQLVGSEQQAQSLRQQNYICKRVSSQYLCEKKIQMGPSIPQNVMQALMENTPKKVQLNPSQDRFSLVHESESYMEWRKRQSSLVDNEKFTSTHWREVQGTNPRIILRRGQDSVAVEFLVINQSQIARFITVRSTGTTSWKSYTALVMYR